MDILKAGKATIYVGDVREWAKTWSGDGLHAMYCDPPYEISMMGRAWDASGVAFDPSTWAAFLPHLLPGALCMAFASSRGWHRLGCAIEDAGFILHPSIWGWSYGSGYPKGSDVSKHADRTAIVTCPVCQGSCIDPDAPLPQQWDQDRRPCPRCDGDGVVQGAEREVIGVVERAPCKGGGERTHHSGGDMPGRQDITAPATDLAKAWDGYKYGRQVTKPALEPLLCFQKPWQGTQIENILDTGCGAWNVGGSRIPLAEGDDGSKVLADQHGDEAGGFYRQAGRHGETLELKPDGRWPANITLIHTPDCTDEACHPDCPVVKLGEQSGNRMTSGAAKNKRPSTAENHGMFALGSGNGEMHDDEGTASRYFFQASWNLDRAEPTYYCPKASVAEKEAGLDGFEAKKVASGSSNNLKQWESGERTFDELDERSKAFTSERKNTHNCCKPLTLGIHYTGLLLPPPNYAPRRCLVPFCGSGSEAIAAVLSGFDEVICIEQDPHYAKIAQARLLWWQAQTRWLEPGTKPDIAAILAAVRKDPQDQNQLGLFNECEVAS